MMKTNATQLVTVVLVAGFATSTLADKKKDEGLKKLLDDFADYVIFPSVAKGGVDL